MARTYEIKSVLNPSLKKILKLKDKKARLKAKKYLVEGFHMVDDAYLSGVLLAVITNKEIGKYKDVDIISVSDVILKKISSTKMPQGIIGICKMEEGSQNLLYEGNLLLLDNIGDPGNLGTLVRSALGFGFKTIVLSKNSVDIYNDKVLRATQGAIFKVNCIYRDLTLVLLKLKEKGINVIAADVRGRIPLSKINVKGKCAVLLGNEARGISGDILRLADVVVRIETEKELESLNVGVAGSIVMRELYIKN